MPSFSSTELVSSWLLGRRIFYPTTPSVPNWSCLLWNIRTEKDNRIEDSFSWDLVCVCLLIRWLIPCCFYHLSWLSSLSKYLGHTVPSCVGLRPLSEIFSLELAYRILLVASDARTFSSKYVRSAVQLNRKAEFRGVLNATSHDIYHFTSIAPEAPPCFNRSARDIHEPSTPR